MVCESALITGGAEKVAIQEAIELRRRGIRVGYIAANDAADTGLTNAGAEVLLLNTKSFYEEPDRKLKLQKLRANFAIEERVRTYFGGFSPNETVVHLHTFRLKLSGIVAHIAQNMGFATVVHCHDYSPVCPTSLWFDHRTGANCTRKPMSLSCIACECQNQSWKYKLPKLTSHFWNQSVWKINQRARTLIHISELERITTDRTNGSTTGNIKIPPISSFRSVNRVKAEQNLSFVFIGRLTQEKGIEPFLHAAAAEKISVVVVGDGPLRKALEEQYPDVRFMGWLDETGIITELNQARALVAPSLWRETLCLSVIDAMQMGVPCVVSENVGAKEFIEDGTNGIVYSAGQLTASLSRLLDDNFVQQLSQAAFSTFDASPPTIGRHVDALEKIYLSALGGVRDES